MNNIRYVILFNKKRDYTPKLIRQHVKYLKGLEERGNFVLGGPFQDHAGGMMIIKADSLADAKCLADADPFISEAYSEYEIRTLELSNSENKHLGMG